MIAISIPGFRLWFLSGSRQSEWQPAALSVRQGPTGGGVSGPSSIYLSLTGANPVRSASGCSRNALATRDLAFLKKNVHQGSKLVSPLPRCGLGRWSGKEKTTKKKLSKSEHAQRFISNSLKADSFLLKHVLWEFTSSH